MSALVAVIVLMMIGACVAAFIGLATKPERRAIASRSARRNHHRLTLAPKTRAQGASVPILEILNPFWII